MLDQKQLHQIALDYPWYMFTGEEIAELCNVSQNVISRVKAMSDSPFFLNKCRPEWFLDWMRNHPEFQLTKSCLTIPETPVSNQANVAFVGSTADIGTGSSPRSKRPPARRSCRRK